MKTISVEGICLLALIFAFSRVANAFNIEENNNGNKQVPPKGPNSNFGSVVEKIRVRRQEEGNSTTEKPKKYRPYNFQHFVQELKDETKHDINEAAKEIRNLFESQFINSTESSAENSTEVMMTNTTATTSSSANDEDDEDEDDEEEEETSKFTREEFFDVLRSNLEGIARLADKEYRKAIQDSERNEKQFYRDLDKTLRDYFTNNVTEPRHIYYKEYLPHGHQQRHHPKYLPYGYQQPHRRPQYLPYGYLQPHRRPQYLPYGR